MVVIFHVSHDDSFGDETSGARLSTYIGSAMDASTMVMAVLLCLGRET
jgi:hypothetical protein